LIDKKEFLLHSIIRAYIENLEPIGSNQLKSMYDISYSPATIRGYFKKLGDEGYLEQEHISSGRTPTIEALKEYWGEKLNFTIENVDYKRLKTLAHNMGFGVFIQQIHSNKLQRILNIEDVYMILEFNSMAESSSPFEQVSDSFAITIKYTPALYRFLSDMVGIELDDILSIAKQVGATQLYDELNRYIQKSEFEMINTKTFLKFAVHYDLDEEMINSFMNGSIMQGLKEGVYFENLLPSGFMGVCHSTKIANQDVRLLVVGELSKDYDYFYRGII
jgi:heat-inducible transcriptional repressor